MWILLKIVAYAGYAYLIAFLLTDHVSMTLSETDWDQGATYFFLGIGFVVLRMALWFYSNIYNFFRVRISFWRYQAWRRAYLKSLK